MNKKRIFCLLTCTFILGTMLVGCSSKKEKEEKKETNKTQIVTNTENKDIKKDIKPEIKKEIKPEIKKEKQVTKQNKTIKTNNNKQQISNIEIEESIYRFIENKINNSNLFVSDKLIDTKVNDDKIIVNLTTYLNSKKFKNETQFKNDTIKDIQNDKIIKEIYNYLKNQYNDYKLDLNINLSNGKNKIYVFDYNKTNPKYNTIVNIDSKQKEQNTQNWKYLMIRKIIHEQKLDNYFDEIKLQNTKDNKINLVLNKNIYTYKNYKEEEYISKNQLDKLGINVKNDLSNIEKLKESLNKDKRINFKINKVNISYNAYNAANKLYKTIVK